jgi:hypothetical protein
MSERYRAELLLHPEGEWTFYADSLDAAWAEAEAALPERYGLSLNAWNAEIVAMADLMSAATESELRSAPSFRGTGPTPAAALRSLTEKLREVE